MKNTQIITFIENMKMSLVKWYVGTRADQSLYVEREVLSGEIPIR